MFVLNSENFVRIFPDFFTESMKLLRLSPDHLIALFTCLRIEHRHAGFDDPCLLRSDLSDRISQIFHVVHADGGDD